MAAILAVLQRRGYERARRRERIFRDRGQPLELGDGDIFRKYRFTRDGCMHVINLIRPLLQHDTQRNQALPPELQVFIVLNFYATGAVLDSTATIHGITRSTASRVIHRVSVTLGTLKHEIIKFPTTMEEVNRAQVDFFNISGFPQVIGVVDGTHIRLNGAPLGPGEHVYMNRKRYYSINTQIICDTNYKIINILARWPGSTHDSRIFQNSRVGQTFEDLQQHGLLLGDSGYALRPYLMTPVLNPRTPAEQAYNRAHATTRVRIEQVNGQLKHKFRCLLNGMQMAPRRACKIITACAVLHNVAKDLKQPDEVDFGIEQHEHEPDRDDHIVDNGLAIRNTIIANYFH
ncbi:putative nuclease HARBI1 [Strongylocentrotus purpuratus]|uniref:Putative nuclease HARBI1 n=1 Tax=Strongylocentrotus purpuratus TaxID=7668 RepID=A0A7M7PFB8_STRPU|nr:putative nuclease HARBI1 [Strongylocentrotus purpuratus]